VAEDLVLDRMPLCESREILDDPGCIRPEVVRAVFVNENPRLIILILGIPPDVIPLLHDSASGPALVG